MSQFIEYVKMAIFNILANKVRSLLTMLGIIIGISSVILIMSLGNGARDMITEQLGALASGQIQVQSMEPGYNITREDMDYILENVEGVKSYALSDAQEGSIVTPKGKFTAYAYGSRPDVYLFETNEKMIAGRYYNQDEYDNAKPVCYINKKDAYRLFGNEDVLGMQVEVELPNGYLNCTIVGITDYSEDSSMLSFAYADAPIYINCPYTTFIQASRKEEMTENYIATFLADEDADTKEVCDRILSVLAARHDCVGKDYYQIQDFNNILGTINKVINLLTLFIALVAAISLVVGGVGVMNIMLVSVTERTREIGIRKALGATTGSITLQFLSESAILTMIGGILGILLGVGGAFLITRVVAMVKPEYAFNPSLSFFTIVGTTLFSSAVGIFFGIYPARKAAKLSPIEALRQM